MVLDDVAKLLLGEFWLNFDFENAFFGQVCIYPRVAGLDDLVNVGLQHIWVRDWDLLDLLGVILLEVDYLRIGSGLADYQDMLVVSMQTFNLVVHLHEMSLLGTRWVLQREYHEYFVASQAKNLSVFHDLSCSCRVLYSLSVRID